MSRPTWQDAECADGKAITEWLASLGDVMTTKKRLTDSQKKHWRDWEDGSHMVAEFYTVDKIVCRLGLHVQDVPDKAWIHRPEKAPSLTEADVPDKKCEHCGKPISRRAPNGKKVTPRVYMRRRFCSDKCVRNGKFKPMICQADDCNKPITENLYRNPKYCSRKCQWKHCGRAPGSRKFQKQITDDRKAA